MWSPTLCPAHQGCLTIHLLQAPTKLHLTLIEPGSDDYKQSVNGQLLAAGLARLVEPKGPQVGAAAVAMHSRGRLAGPLGGEATSAHAAQPPLPHHSQSPETAKVLEALRACQDEARRKHVGIYEFGDVDSEEEDDGGALCGGAVVCEAAVVLCYVGTRRKRSTCEVARACLNVAQQLNINAR